MEPVAGRVMQFQKDHNYGKSWALSNEDYELSEGKVQKDREPFPNCELNPLYSVLFCGRFIVGYREYIPRVAR